MKEIVVLYHRNCPDGFTSAYCAWKKFGDQATYIAMSHGQEPPEGLEGKEVYMIDYSFKKEVMLDLEQKVKRLVVLDHHLGAKEAVESVKEHIFNNDHSGAGIAWRYFHPTANVPRLIDYVEDNDINKNSLPNIREVTTYTSIQPFEFEHFDKLVQKMETDEGLKEIVAQGEAYQTYLKSLCDYLATKAEEVEIDGHRVFAVNVQGSQLVRDELGHRLSAQKGRPFAIIWCEDSKGRGFSLRGDGSVDLSLLAQKYGGNGHKGAASFRLPHGNPMPFTYVQ
jgi:nanoRNase/pAp phosphatase (c-di-AMP/oligoRNAs hydrolase)